MRQIQWMAERVGFKILDVELNDVNGGSFSITVAKASGTPTILPAVQQILDQEYRLGLHTLVPYQEFAERVAKNKSDLLEFFSRVKADGKTVGALGASTKGNVLLQYCGLTDQDISFVGEVNAEKFDCYTPGTWIPIIPEKELLAKKMDFLVVLPWHFRKFFEQSNALRGQKLVFPLPWVVTVER